MITLKFYTGASPIPYCLANSGMIGKSKEFDDVGRAVASSVPTYLGKIKATLLTGYYIGVFLLAEWLYSRSTAI